MRHYSYSSIEYKIPKKQHVPKFVTALHLCKHTHNKKLLCVARMCVFCERQKSIVVGKLLQQMLQRMRQLLFSKARSEFLRSNTHTHTLYAHICKYMLCSTICVLVLTVFVENLLPCHNAIRLCTAPSKKVLPMERQQQAEGGCAPLASNCSCGLANSPLVTRLSCCLA